MRFETYLKYRTIFERRFIEAPNWQDVGVGYEGATKICGQVNLYDIKEGIRNFELFLNILAHDKYPTFVFGAGVVSSIEKRKRWSVKNRPAIMVKLLRPSRPEGSLLEKFPDQYDGLIAHLKGNKKPHLTRQG